MSFAGLSLRFLQDATTLQVLIYRALGLAAIVPFIACWRRKVGPVAFFSSLGREDLMMGLLMASAFSCYVYSILNTSVASTLFILAAVPFMTAVFGWVWIGEKPKKTTWITMLVALGGVGLMVTNGLGNGQLFGNLMALLSGASFALALVYVRRVDRDDMLGGTFLGGILASLFNLGLALAVGQSILVSSHDLFVSVFSGVATIGIGMAFVIWGASWLPAAEVSILALLESVAGPFWVWLVFRETVSPTLLLGGAVVLGCVIVQAWFSRPRRQATRNFRYGSDGVEVHRETE